MLVYPSDIEERLEVDEIRRRLRAYCSTEAGSERVNGLQPIDKRELLSRYLQETDEMIRLLDSQGPPSTAIGDIQPLIKKVQTNGTFLSAEDLGLLKSFLFALHEWTQFLKKRSTLFPALGKMAIGFVADQELALRIDQQIDERGEVRDNATPALQEIRKRLVIAEKKVRKVVHQILEQSKKDEFTEDDGAVTIRGGRLVIPVKAEYKRKLPGFIHDESSTGQTVFMEPTQVLDLNNEVREIQYEERREITRILLELSDLIREQMADLEKGGRFVIRLDVLRAKALFGKSFDAIVPKLLDRPHISLINARHPVLWKKHESQQKETVPLSIELKDDTRIVVISGPNAGGKSVALKTIGILQYCFQCAIPVPVAEGSEMGIFRNIFIDIGDAQSLENDLSTYSSHLKAMKYFCEFSDKQSLVLIDEFGTGTEPQFGGAIAQSILVQLHKNRCKGVITTHYANLKELANDTEGITNASMRYDIHELKPLFVFEMGKPGSSFAMEIARQIGIPKEVLTRAKTLIGHDQIQYDRLLAELDGQRRQLEEGTSAVQKERQQIATLKKDYEDLKQLVAAERKQRIKETKKEALDILKGANQKVENLIREIRESAADKEKTKELRKTLDEEVQKLQRETKPDPQPTQRKEPTSKEALKVGDKVRLVGQDSTGEILNLKGKQAEVTFGDLKSFVKTDRLERVSNKQARKNQRSTSRGLDLQSRMASFSYEIDVRGKRAEEVLPLIDKMLDDAVLLGTQELRIVHGKGHGILKEVVRNHLKEDNNVLSFSDEHADRGGSGITLVTLK